MYVNTSPIDLNKIFAHIEKSIADEWNRMLVIDAVMATAKQLEGKIINKRYFDALREKLNIRGLCISRSQFLGNERIAFYVMGDYLGQIDIAPEHERIDPAWISLNNPWMGTVVDSYINLVALSIDRDQVIDAVNNLMAARKNLSAACDRLNDLGIGYFEELGRNG